MPKKILLIDDDPDLLNAVSMILESKSYEVAAAFGGIEGLEKAKTEKPDLILLDILMPDMSGLDVLRKMKEEKIKHSRVIVLTVLADDFTKKEIKRLGAIDFLLKSDLELAEIVERVMVYLK